MLVETLSAKVLLKSKPVLPLKIFFMKKNIFIVLLFLALILVFSSAQIYNGDCSKVQKKNLYKENKVWMVYGWTFQYPKGIQEKKGKKTSFERFDRNGNRTEEIYYEKKDVASFSCQYLYDENGNEVKKMGGSGDEVIYEKWIYTPIDNAEKIEKKSEYKKGKEQKWVYTLNTDKDIAEETYYDMNGTMTYKRQYIYDVNDNLIEKKEIDPYGNIYQKWVYDYDDKGNNIELHHYVSNNQLYRIYQMRYDKKGNMKSKFEFDKDENVLLLTVFVYQFYDGLHAARTVGNKQ